MARIKLNEMFTTFSGRIGNIGIYNWEGDIFARGLYRHVDRKSPLQLDLRDAFRKAVASWQELSEKETRYWNRMSRKRRVRGYHLYISTYMLNRWDRLEGPEIRPGRAAGAEYFETAGGPTELLHSSSGDDSIPVRCPFVGPSSRLEDCLYPGIVES